MKIMLKFITMKTLTIFNNFIKFVVEVIYLNKWK